MGNTLPATPPIVNGSNNEAHKVMDHFMICSGGLAIEEKKSQIMVVGKHESQIAYDLSGNCKR